MIREDRINDKALMDTISQMKEDITMLEWALINSPSPVEEVIERYHDDLKHHMQQISYHKRVIKRWAKRRLQRMTETT